MSLTIPAPGRQPKQELDASLATPSALTNRLIANCLGFKRGEVSVQELSDALDDCARNLVSARDAFYGQVQENGLIDVIPGPIQTALDAFQDYTQALLFAKNSAQDPQANPIESAALLLHDSYMGLYDALLAYEWAYLGQGDEPHPALNLLSKSISAAQQRLMPDDRLNDILDRLWDYFINEQEEAERTITDIPQRTRKINAIQQTLSGIQVMDEYFDQYDINYLLTGYARCHQGCLLIIEQIQETTGEALADAPTPSPQVNWVIHTAKAVIDGLSTELLTKAQAWFEPQLNESFFRFEQYASIAAQNPNTPNRILEQITVARNGFDCLNKALPLLRLGLERRHLLLKAIQHLEEGADLIYKAWDVFESLENEGSQPTCVRCGTVNAPGAHTCNRCGAPLIQETQEQVVVPLEQPQQMVTNEPNAPQTAANSRPPAHIARLLSAIDNARAGRLTVDSFAAEIKWGRQILQAAVQNTARLPQSSPDRHVNEALAKLRHGLQQFAEAMNEMEAFLKDYHPSHLDCGTSLLNEACSIFEALQQLSGR